VLQNFEKLIQGLLVKSCGSVDGWFSQDEQDCLRKSLLKHYQQDEFHLAGIGKHAYFQKEKEIRNDQVYWLSKAEANACELRFFQLVDEFVAYLNRTCFAGIRSYEFHYALYEQGSFYKKHVDQFMNDDRRQFSFVTYLTEFWEPGDGGELILYLKKERVTVQPIPGRALFFRSEIPHEVLPANKKRLSITGWLKSG
jgi:SM-20-related protein